MQEGHSVDINTISAINISEDDFEIWLKDIGAYIAQHYKHCKSQPLLSESEELLKMLTNPESLPVSATLFSSVIAKAQSLFNEGLCNVSHPLYFGYISPKPHPFAVLGDLLANGLNQTPGAWRAGPAATTIEVQTISWLRELFKLPKPQGSLPGGIFTGGGTIANTLALKVARDKILGQMVQKEGFSSMKCRVYTSKEGHFSLDKAVDTLGLGTNNLVKIDVDRFGAMIPSALRDAIEQDIRNGYKPLCIVATLGTTATGAIDPLIEIGTIAQESNVWYHLDAASGLALAALEQARNEMIGLEVADSITFDPCKWMFVSFGMGCLLVNDGRVLSDSFNAGGHYWEEKDDLDLFKMNLYGTRQFRSLGLWCLLSGLGSDGYRELLQNLVCCAGHFRKLISEDNKYILLEQQGYMPIVCFGINTIDVDYHNTLIQAIIDYCHKRNLAYPTAMDWNGKRYIRLAFSNYTISMNDVNELKCHIDEGLRIVSSRLK